MVVPIMAGALIYGVHQLSQKKVRIKTAPSLNAAVVQANIDQSVKWKPSFQIKTLETYFRLSRSVGRNKPALIVWPETALPLFYQDAPRFSPRMEGLSEELGAILLFGSPAYSRTGGGIEYYNRAYMIAPGASSTRYYDKRHLVPFGEYVPLEEISPLYQPAGSGRRKLYRWKPPEAAQGKGSLPGCPHLF